MKKKTGKKPRCSWILSILSVLTLIACSTSESWGEPKEWTVTWTDNSDNESEFVLYQFDETLSTPDWKVIATFPADTTSSMVILDASKGARVGLSARNPAGESGMATHQIDSKYFIIPAMPGIIDFKPF